MAVPLRRVVPAPGCCHGDQRKHDGFSDLQQVEPNSVVAPASYSASLWAISMLKPSGMRVPGNKRPNDDRTPTDARLQRPPA